MEHRRSSSSALSRPAPGATEAAMEAITRTEADHLAACEEVIERGLRGFIEVGRALLAIRDQRLYRATHTSFESYLQERWGIGRRRGDQLCAASEVVQQIANHGSDLLPRSERLVRPLMALPEDQRASAWRQVVFVAGTVPTIADVEAVVARMKSGDLTWPQAASRRQWQEELLGQLCDLTFDGDPLLAEAVIGATF